MLVKRKLPTHAVLKEGQLKEIDLKGCSGTTSISYLCMAMLQLKDGCLNNASLCTNSVKKLSGTDWMMNSFGYLLASDEDCMYKSGGRFVKDSIKGGLFHFIPLNDSAAVFCRPDLLLSLEKRAFEYSYH